MSDIEEHINDIPREHDCPICLSNINDTVSTECNHVYCKKCLNEWLETGKTYCPLCRADIKIYSDNINSYKIIKIFNSPQSTREVISREIYENLINKIQHLRIFTFILSALSIILYDFYIDLSDRQEDLLFEYNICMDNNTNLVSILNHLDDQPFIGVLMSHAGQHLKKCSIPEKYYIDC